MKRTRRNREGEEQLDNKYGGAEQDAEAAYTLYTGTASCLLDC